MNVYVVILDRGTLFKAFDNIHINLVGIDKHRLLQVVTIEEEDMDESKDCSIYVSKLRREKCINQGCEDYSVLYGSINKIVQRKF